MNRRGFLGLLSGVAGLAAVPALAADDKKSLHKAFEHIENYDITTALVSWK